MWHKLVEPVGLLYGQMARDAVARGFARPLMDGPAAFTHVRLIEGTVTSPLMPLADVPKGWEAELHRLSAPTSHGMVPPGPQVMGILNVTPDSFSNGGQHFQAEEAIKAGLAMVEVGCGVLDIGGESTRPGSSPVTPEQEWARVAPVLAGLRARAPQATLSIDTRHSLVMARALSAGAAVVNDVTALRHDPAALPLLAAQNCGVVLMHMRGTPQTMERYAVYDDVACEVVRELGQRVQVALQAGIARERLMVDPGFGFAKTAAQNVVLLRRCLLLANLGCRVVFALSRKRMLGEMTGVARAEDRDAASMAASLPAMAFGAPLLRVHDVPAMVQGMRVWQAICRD
ncbi:MAG: dihydropteroate synthase [Acetobacter sp.]|uniref:dihydropteroate synthase n=1 Tax=Acetobacter sp. TaxID=440 RepID=UPI0039ED4CC6